METQRIEISKIRLDGDTQPRLAIDQTVVEEYAEAMSEGREFPPVTVYHDGIDHWLVDGFHRFHAARKLGHTEVNAIIKTGLQAEAKWASLGANKDHGLRRSNADKQNAVIKALKFRPELSDGAIADHLGVSQFTVSKYRRQLSPAASTQRISESTTCTGRDGRKYNVSNIKKQAERRRESKPLSPAMKIIRDPGPAAPMQAISLPYDPHHGARALINHFNREYCEQLVVELRKLLDARATVLA